MEVHCGFHNEFPIIHIVNRINSNYHNENFSIVPPSIKYQERLKSLLCVLLPTPFVIHQSEYMGHHNTKETFLTPVRVLNLDGNMVGMLVWNARTSRFGSRFTLKLSSWNINHKNSEFILIEIWEGGRDRGRKTIW